MNEVFASYVSVQNRVTANPGWMEDVGRAIVREEVGHGYWFDTDHPAWIAAWERRKKTKPPPMDPAVRDAIRRQVGGCRGCGDSNPFAENE
jgi:hypothetical protein